MPKMRVRVLRDDASYYAQLSSERPLFQGDIFVGAFGAFWRHPEAVLQQRTTGTRPAAGPLAVPGTLALKDAVDLTMTGYVMLLPQPCEFSEEEKGANHPFRVVAPLLPLKDAGSREGSIASGKLLSSMVLPAWGPAGTRHYVDLRYTTTIDTAFLGRDNRVAALSWDAWILLADRLSQYFAGVPLDYDLHLSEQGPNYPGP
jgi:hypothetical protein